MKLEQAERERIVRFYQLAKKTVQNDVRAGFPMLHLLGMTEQEDRNRFQEFGIFDVDPHPQQGVLARWEKSLRVGHRTACQLLHIAPVQKLDFFPTVMTPSIANGWQDSDKNALHHPEVVIDYQDLIESHFAWKLDFGSRYKQVNNDFTQESERLEYSYKLFDWVVKPKIEMYSFAMKESLSSSVGIEFGVYREDYKKEDFYAVENLKSDHYTLRVFTPFHFFCLPGFTWSIESEKQSEAYQPRFKQVVEFFTGALAEILQDLNIDD